MAVKGTIWLVFSILATLAATALYGAAVQAPTGSNLRLAAFLAPLVYAAVQRFGLPNRRQPFGWWWVPVTAIGETVIAVIGFVFLWGLSPLQLPIALIAMAVPVAAVAGIQAKILARLGFRRTGAWIGASYAGHLLSGAVLVLTHGYSDVIAMLAAGILLAVPQAMILSQPSKPAIPPGEVHPA